MHNVEHVIAHLEHVCRLLSYIIDKADRIADTRVYIAAASGGAIARLREVLPRLPAYYNALRTLNQLEELKQALKDVEQTPPTLLEDVLINAYSALLDAYELHRLLSDTRASIAYVEAGLCQADLVNTILDFISETLNLLLTLYGPGPRIKILLLLHGVESPAIYWPLTVEEEGEHIILIYYPWGLCSEGIRPLISLLHEFGHIHLNLYAKPTHVENIAKQAASLLGLERVEDVAAWRQWLREIYADAFALAIGGTGYIKSLIKFYYPLLARQTAHEEQHPPILLRLYMDLHLARTLYNREPKEARIIKTLAEQHTGTRRLAGYHVSQLDQLAQQILPNFLKPILETNLARNIPPSQELTSGELAQEYKTLKRIIRAWNNSNN